MFGGSAKKNSALNLIFDLFFLSLYLTTFFPLCNAGIHMLSKRSSEIKIAPEECEKKIKESEAKDAECFEIDQDKKCDEHCNDLGEEKCGGTKGKSYNFQCKNPQKGSKKACCCAYKCETKEETKKRLEELFAKMRKDNRGLCSPFTDSEDGFKTELKRICAKEERIHIARKYCLEEKKGEKYFCLKMGECKGKRTKTCLGCIAHECVMEGEDEGEHIVIPEEYEKERLEKQDFDKTAAGNVEDMNSKKKDKVCTKIKCKEDDCDKKCRKFCKDHGNKECEGKALSYGTAVEGKRSGGKEGENECCCEPVCSLADNEKSTKDEKKDDGKSEEIKKRSDGDKEDVKSEEKSTIEEDSSNKKDSHERSGEDNKKLSSGYEPSSEDKKSKRKNKQKEPTSSETKADESKGPSDDEIKDESKSSTREESFYERESSKENEDDNSEDGGKQDYANTNDFYAHYGLSDK